MKLLFFFSTLTQPRLSAEIISSKKELAQNNYAEVIHCYYHSFEEFCNRVKQLKLPPSWKISYHDHEVKALNFDDIHSIPKYEIYINKQLKFFVRLFGWKLKPSHAVYTNHEQSVKSVTLSNLITIIENQYKLCQGISDEKAKQKFIQHVMPKHYSSSADSGDCLYTKLYNIAIQTVKF